MFLVELCWESCSARIGECLILSLSNILNSGTVLVALLRFELFDGMLGA